MIYCDVYLRTPRHNMTQEDIKNIYPRFELIKRGFKRKSKIGYSYTLCYEESTNIFVKIGYIFDKEPPEIFMGIRIFRNLEKSISRKYGLTI